MAEPPDAAAVSWLPVVGIVIGAVAGALGWLASFALPPLPATVVAVGAAIVLSGAIHLDGFLDACDGLFASVEGARRLAILKDPHHGTYALAGLAIVVPAWIAAAASLSPADWPWTFAFCAGAARAAAVVNAWRFPNAGGGMSAHAFERRPSGAVVAFGALVAAGCCWQQPVLALALLPAVAAALALGAWCARRLGGVLTGDCYGAIVVVLEVALLVTIASVRAGPLR